MLVRPIQGIAIVALLFFGATNMASAGDIGTQLAAADMLKGFGSSTSLNETELGSVSGFGLGQQPISNGADRQDISVILFDELGQPKSGGISAGTGAASTVTSNVNVSSGR